MVVLLVVVALALLLWWMASAAGDAHVWSPARTWTDAELQRQKPRFVNQVNLRFKSGDYVGSTKYGDKLKEIDEEIAKRQSARYIGAVVTEAEKIETLKAKFLSYGLDEQAALKAALGEWKSNGA